MDPTAYTPHQLGQVLHGRRKTLKLTQQQVAAIVGMLPKTVSRLELDAGSATIDSLFKVLSALGLEIVVRAKSRPSSKREW